MEHWINTYGILDEALTDNGSEFTAKMFELTCTSLVVKHLPTSTDQPQTNSLVEQYNRILVAHLRHYVVDQQRNWHLFIQPLTYAYNTQVHKSTKQVPLPLALSRLPVGPPPTDRIEKTEDAVSQLISTNSSLTSSTD